MAPKPRNPGIEILCPDLSLLFKLKVYFNLPV